MSKNIKTSLNEFLCEQNNFSMIPSDKSGDYKYEEGDFVLFANANYSENRGTIVELTKSGMNNQLWNYYKIKTKTGKIETIDENDIIMKLDVKVPEIFQYTIYRLPTVEELENVNNCNLSADEIVNGFSYTIIGRGMKSHKNIEMIIKCIELLCEQYPENEKYKVALEIAKKIEPRKF